VDQRVPAEDRPPTVGALRPDQPGEVADVVADAGEARERLLDHPRREIEAAGVDAHGAQVGRDVSGPAPGVDDGPVTGLGGDPVEQPALEGQVLELGANRSA